MKNSCSIFLLVLSMFVLGACKKNNPDAQSELAKLPQATQTGANTIGCLVNGKAFLPSYKFLSGLASYQCNYIYWNGGYNFYIGIINDDGLVAAGTENLAIAENKTYNFSTYGVQGNASAEYFATPNDIINDAKNTYFTNAKVSGKLYISKLDSIKQIASGTFYFNAVNAYGDTVHVTEGRFDMRYTQ